jgi:hypothetical protein
VSKKQFKQLCFDLASRNDGKVINYNTPQYPANFYYVQVEIFDNRFYILLNKHYPYLSFASIVELGNIKFIDNPVLFNQFSLFYQVLGTGELNVPITQIVEEKNKLNTEELEQIAYWKPDTVGQIIFNYWD